MCGAIQYQGGPNLWGEKETAPLNLNPTGGYDSHTVVHSVGSRQRERELAHRRATDEARLESRGSLPDPGFVARFLARWRQRASIAIEPTLSSADRAVTDTVCLLTDGTLGRIVLRRIDGRWVEDCVPV
jgi:hypothetical protein